MDVKDLIYSDFMDGMTYKAMSEKYGVKEYTIKDWRKRYGWKREKKAGAPKGNKNAAGSKSGGAPKGNKNAAGGKGGAAPKGNKNAEKYGFYSKWIPNDVLEIMREIDELSPLDMLWEQISMQYTAIIRAQHLMYVKDRQDVTREITMQGDGATAWEIQQAWDKHEKFMNAQSKAMNTLNGLIRQYEEMLRHEEEKEDVAEERRQRIAKIKAETNRIKEDKDTKDMQVNIVMSSEVSQYAD